MDALRRFLKTSGGRAVGLVLSLACVAAAVFVLRDSLGGNEATAVSRDRTYICAQTGKPFEYTIKLGDRIPVESPHSGQKTGYPAEMCYWTADGKPKGEPTPVLLNQYAGKSGPTFCPDCKRMVTGQNPPAAPDMKPPPTEDAYQRSRKEPR